MAARPQELLTPGAVIKSYLVNTAKTVRKGMPVLLVGGGIEECTTSTENIFGIAFEQETNIPATTQIPYLFTAPAGSRVSVVLLGHGVVPVLVGTGGVTAGLPVRSKTGTSDGVTDAVVGGGTTKIVVIGQAVEAGVVGDLVGVNLGVASYTVGS
jgi:hypothetical protein